MHALKDTHMYRPMHMHIHTHTLFCPLLSCPTLSLCPLPVMGHLIMTFQKSKGKTIRLGHHTASVHLAIVMVQLHMKARGHIYILNPTVTCASVANSIFLYIYFV